MLLTANCARSSVLGKTSIAVMDRNSEESDNRCNPSEATRTEIRSVLLRHWQAIDRARLNTFHLWLLLFTITHIAIINYLLPKV